MSITQKHDFRAETQALISEMPKGFILWSNTALFLVMVILLAISCFISYPQTIRVRAEIQPRNSSIMMNTGQNTEGVKCKLFIPKNRINQIEIGQISLININTNQIPAKGTITCILDIPVNDYYLAEVQVQNQNTLGGNKVRYAYETYSDIIIEEPLLIEQFFQPIKIFFEKQKIARKKEHSRITQIDDTLIKEGVKPENPQ
jgi:hypothetical protein